MFRLRNLVLPLASQVLWAVASGAAQTYNAKVIREDLQNAENRITPTETPFISMIATDGEKASATLHEWPLVALQAASGSNRVAEGDDAPSQNTPNYASRRSNYTQISTKTLKLSDTSQAVDDAAKIIDKAKQITYKLLELKRDKETMLLDSVAAAPGAVNGGSVRTAAGMTAFYMTNAQRGASGTAPTLSGSTQGYPNAIGTDGTLRALTEDMLNNGIQASWNAGGRPRFCLVSPTNKRLISKTFNAYGTRYNATDSQKLISAVDVYKSDFGEIQIVPDRFSRGRDVHILDPEYVAVCNLTSTKQTPLARTGLTDNTLISGEYTLWVGNEAAHALIADTQG